MELLCKGFCSASTARIPAVEDDEGLPRQEFSATLARLKALREFPADLLLSFAQP